MGGAQGSTFVSEPSGRPGPAAGPRCGAPGRMGFVTAREGRPGGTARREFLKTTGAVAAAVAVPGAAAAAQEADGRRLDLPLLQAVAEAVLPPEIGADGVREALRDFVRWLDGFEPVAELPHPYLSSDQVRYGPPDPAPMWAAQLAALELLAPKAPRRRLRGARIGAAPESHRRRPRAVRAGPGPARPRLRDPCRGGSAGPLLFAPCRRRPRLRRPHRAAACRDLASGAEKPPALDAGPGVGRGGLSRAATHRGGCRHPRRRDQRGDGGRAHRRGHRGVHRGDRGREPHLRLRGSLQHAAALPRLRRKPLSRRPHSRARLSEHPVAFHVGGRARHALGRHHAPLLPGRLPPPQPLRGRP